MHRLYYYSVPIYSTVPWCIQQQFITNKYVTGIKVNKDHHLCVPLPLLSLLFLQLLFPLCYSSLHQYYHYYIFPLLFHDHPYPFCGVVLLMLHHYLFRLHSHDHFYLCCGLPSKRKMLLGINKPV